MEECTHLSCEACVVKDQVCEVGESIFEVLDCMGVFTGHGVGKSDES